MGRDSVAGLISIIEVIDTDILFRFDNGSVLFGASEGNQAGNDDLQVREKRRKKEFC